MVPFEFENVEETANKNEVSDDVTSSYEQLPFKVIHPSNFQKPIYKDDYYLQKGNLETKAAQNINNFKIINEPLKFEDFNVVDALMAEPIWSTIEHNVGGDVIGAVSDIIPDHEMDHLSLSLPESSAILSGDDNSDYQPMTTEQFQSSTIETTSATQDSEIIRSRVSRSVKLEKFFSFY